MRIRTIIHLICSVSFFSFSLLSTEAEEFTNAIHAYFQEYIKAQQMNAGVVVGIVDENGSNTVSCGKMDNGTDQEVDGDTVFEIGSDTKTFTGLLLQVMVERGEMNLDDPVEKYLPESVTIPARNGKKITLRHLATHASGLPVIPDNLAPERAETPYAGYTVERLYDFLSRYKLNRDPGAESRYSNLGMGLLGHVIGLKAGTSYETLVVNEICRPLKMDSTLITLTPELKSRFAVGHNRLGEPVPAWEVTTLAGAGALRSTANDMLKYLSANLGLTSSSLTPLMEKTHEKGLGWYAKAGPKGTKIITHGGGTGGFRSDVAFDKSQRRGVVVLCNSRGAIELGGIDTFLLQSEWQSARRPKEIKPTADIAALYVGRYKRIPNPDLFRRFLLNASDAEIYVTAGIFSSVLLVALWRTASFRRRCIIQMITLIVGGGLLATLIADASKNEEPSSESIIGMRQDGDRLFAQAIGSRSWPVDQFLPPVTGELLPESETRFFERLSGRLFTFFRNPTGVTGFTVSCHGQVFAYERISDRPVKAPEPPKRRVAIKLDEKILDACVGEYDFPPDKVSPTGFTMKIWREGDQLLAETHGENVIQGVFNVHAESETNFFLKITDTQLRFIKNEDGEVTASIHYHKGYPEIIGKKTR